MYGSFGSKGSPYESIVVSGCHRESALIATDGPLLPLIPLRNQITVCQQMSDSNAIYCR